MSVINEQKLTESQWQAAHEIAITLAKKTDVNEFRKAIAYLKMIGDRKDAGKSFFSYLNTLAKNGQKIGHSKKTKDYYQDISDVCDNHLVRYKDDSLTMLQILGWAARLVRYYQNNPVGEDFVYSQEAAVPQISKRQEEIAKQTANNDFSEGQIINAMVTGKNTKGSKVTYTIENTTIKLTNKEPKLFDSLSEGEKVKVKIVKLEDEKVKKVKLFLQH